MVDIKIKRITPFIFILSFIIINSKEELERILVYDYENGVSNTIRETDNKFQIDTIHYLDDSWLPMLGNEIINDKDEIKNLLVVFDEIFKDSDEQKIIVKSNELTEKQNEIILKILDEHNIIYQLRYEIINNIDYYDKTYKQRGYSYKYDKGDIFTIAMGERPTGGYSISIRKTKIKDLDLIIYVSEKEPGVGEIVTEALTYPVVQIKLNEYPSSIKVINFDTDEVYPRLREEE